MILRLASLLLLALIALAQYGTGVLLGTVTDTSGAVVAGARVVARNTETNEVREFTSDSSGNFQFNALPAGNYAVTWNVLPSNGGYRVVVVGTDNVGNVSQVSASIPVTVTN